MNLKQAGQLLVAIVVSQLAGIIGSVFTAPAIPGWYATLAKPALNPPSWVFGPVWTTLYALMGVAAFLVWRCGWENPKVKIALGVFGVQLVLNAAWSILFFGLQMPGWAFVDLLLLWLVIFFLITRFYELSKPAAWLLIPYLLWVSFAGYLNYTIWMLN